MVDPISILLLAYVLFVPGFLLTWIIFRGVGVMERMLLSVTFSVMIIVAIGVVLGYDASTAQKTGGITPLTAWIAEINVSLFFGLIAAIMNRKALLGMRFRSIDFKLNNSKKKQIERTRLP